MTSVGCDSTIPTGLVTSTCFQFPSPLVISSSPTSPVYVSETPPCSPYMPSSTTIYSHTQYQRLATPHRLVTTSPRDACSPTFLSPPLSSPSPYPLREPYYTHFRYPPEDFISPVPPNYAASPTLHMGTGREGGYMYDAVPPTLIKMDGPHNIQQPHPPSLKLEQGDCTCGTNYPVMAPFSPNSPLSAVSI
uniref:Uncharacterized protein n=1 Tax=Amphimedon queenslandica TaxID=400682 RepID=A0A1X7TFF1_AMPQE